MPKQAAAPSVQTKPGATYQDVLDAPPHKVAEIIDGTLFLNPRPAPAHADAHGGIFGNLRTLFGHGRGGPGGWRIVGEPELHLGKDVLVPDVAGWRRARMPTLPDTAYFALAPDWVCEVLSPSTYKIDRGRKSAIYAREKIPYMWLVDPGMRTLEAFELESGRWALIDSLCDDAIVALPPFDAVSFPLSDLWDDGDPEATQVRHRAVPEEAPPL